MYEGRPSRFGNPAIQSAGKLLHSRGQLFRQPSQASGFSGNIQQALVAKEAQPVAGLVVWLSYAANEGVTLEAEGRCRNRVQLCEVFGRISFCGVREATFPGHEFHEQQML